LNKVVDTKNPTAEVIARWFWDRLYIKQFGDYLHQIDIWETATNKLSYFQLVSPIKKPIEEDQRASVPCGLSNT
jgi:oligoribonuclease NrnB/cAMP/cGMP phosphodiesterase (DHH superfamily)